LLLASHPVAILAAQQPESGPLEYALSADGTTVTILLDRESVEAMRDLIVQLQQNDKLGKVKAIVYAPAAQAPMLILLGDKEEILQKLALLKQFLPDDTQAHMVVIAASLRELSEEDSLNIGLTLLSDLMGGASASITAGLDAGTSLLPNYSLSASLAAGPITNFLQLNEALNRSKVLVSSEVYTRNGIKAQLTNVQQVPIFSTDSNKNVMTSYQQLETSIVVVPTTLDYKKEAPQESQVRVDVAVKISVITGQHSFGTSITAPEYSTKTFSTTRVLKANNERYVVGTFVTDGEYKALTGVPLLSRIPILKYLFSRDGKQSQRNVAILTLSVRLLPMHVKDLTIDVEHQNPLEVLYERKGIKKDKQ
jgi:type II secretory pathway component GspD/PulD (secretin)